MNRNHETAKESMRLRYEELMHQVENDEFYTRIDLRRKFNVYTCPHGHRTRTQDVDRGVTPYFSICHVCGSRSESSFYKDHGHEMPVHQEWYRPSFDEMIDEEKKYPGTAAHVLNGGLLPRDVKPEKS